MQATEQHRSRRIGGHHTCTTCDTAWPCTSAAAALDAVRTHSRDRDRTTRNEAIRHAVALGLPLDDIGYAAGVTRERIRQIGKHRP
ncbi:hypothetical protein [Haloechinothrix salitolerans]|uniref:hypothetical protein n=1 Tax=Haloechinothrix salitolerans TaxID=926830 RepID=UPI0031E64926